MKALSPRDIDQAAAEGKNVPDFVIAAVNKLLIEKAASKRIIIKQKELIAEIQSCQTVSSGDLFANHWLDFEPHYQAAGWKCYYDKPGYNESYDAFFVFEKP